MNTATISGFPHFRGVWSASYTHNGTAGYERGAEVYGVDVDDEGNHTSAYRSLIDGNTQPLTNTSAWLCYSSADFIRGYVDAQIRENTANFVKEKLVIDVAFDAEAPDDYNVQIRVEDENGEVLGEGVVTDTYALVVQIQPRTRYCVKALSTYEGYTKPAAQWYTALAEHQREVTIMYREIKAGVYIHTVANHVIAPSRFDLFGEETPNAIYIGDGSQAILLALSNLGAAAWGTNGQIPGIPNMSYLSGAALTENPVDSEIAMRAYMRDNPSASFPAWNKVISPNDGEGWKFPDGRRGYMPTAWMWRNMIVPNGDAINSALSSIGRAILSGTYWTSTQFNTIDHAWHGYRGGVSGCDRSVLCQVLPVAAY